MLFRNAALFLGLTGSAVAQTGPYNFAPIAGYIPRTNQTGPDGQLEKDLEQQALEDAIVDPVDGFENCIYFANATDFTDDTTDYLRTLPSYTGTVSDPYDEMLEYYGGPPEPSDKKNFLSRWIRKAAEKKDFVPVNKRGIGLWKDAFIPPSDPIRDCIGFEEVLKKGIAYGAFLIESYQLMQKAIDFAEGGCVAQDNSNFAGPAPCFDAVKAWDAAAAAYVGSLEGTDGNNDELPKGNSGKSPYTLANKRCRNFKNCGVDNGAVYPTGSDPYDLTSPVNTRILALFAAGSQAAWIGDYRLMKGYLRLISNKSAIPLIQGTYRYYYRFDELDGGPFSRSDKELGEGAAFIMPVLPKLWSCSKKGEKLAYAEARVDRRRNIQAGTGAPEPDADPIDFLQIQYAFECNYRCLGITCAEVGELYDGGTSPKPGFVGCDDDINGSTNVCGKASGPRKNLCKFYTGSPGIKDRNKLKFEF